jgi:hypothetical protein
MLKIAFDVRTLEVVGPTCEGSLRTPPTRPADIRLHVAALRLLDNLDIFVQRVRTAPRAAFWRPLVLSSEQQREATEEMCRRVDYHLGVPGRRVRVVLKLGPARAAQLMTVKEVAEWLKLLTPGCLQLGRAWVPAAHHSWPSPLVSLDGREAPNSGREAPRAMT